MSNVRVYFLPESLVNQAWQAINSNNSALTLTKLVADHFGEFISTNTFRVKGKGEKAAREAFDLTNDPKRHQEKLEVCGDRKISIGDIVEVFHPDGSSNVYLCTSLTWRDCEPNFSLL